MRGEKATAFYHWLAKPVSERQLGLSRHQQRRRPHPAVRALLPHRMRWDQFYRLVNWVEWAGPRQLTFTNANGCTVLFLFLWRHFDLFRNNFACRYSVRFKPTLGKNEVITSIFSCVNVGASSPSTTKKKTITPSWIHVAERAKFGWGMQAFWKRGILKAVLLSTTSPLLKINLSAFFCTREIKTNVREQMSCCISLQTTQYTPLQNCITKKHYW